MSLLISNDRTPAEGRFEKGILTSSNFSRSNPQADQKVVEETSKLIRHYLKQGFPSAEQDISNLKDQLGIRALYLEDPSTTTENRANLSFSTVTDRFLDRLYKKLEAGELPKVDLIKLELLNTQIKAGDQIAIDYLMNNFDHETPSKLEAVVQNHKKFIELWKAEPSNLTIDSEFQLVNARTTLNKVFLGQGLSGWESNRRISAIYNVANELSPMQINVKEIINFFSVDPKSTFPNNFTLEDKFKFIESINTLCSQLPPPHGLAVYLRNIFSSTKDVSGNMQEAIVAAQLIKFGWQINELSQQVHNPRTELDIIATKNNQTYIIEVKATSQTLEHKNAKSHDNQITNLLKHADSRGAKLGIFCVNQARIGLPETIRSVNSSVQFNEDLDKVFVISYDGGVHNLAGKKAA